MDQLMTVKGMKERYGCSNPTARRYLRQCDPHTENPLTAPIWAVEEWENSRMVSPAQSVKHETRTVNRERVIVPRIW